MLQALKPADVSHRAPFVSKQSEEDIEDSFDFLNNTFAQEQMSALCDVLFRTQFSEHGVVALVEHTGPYPLCHTTFAILSTARFTCHQADKL